MTAFMTSPFFTLAFGIASLTETTMTSPIEAYRRREPPSTLMHNTLRAPELSATSNMLSACTIDQVLRLRRLELHRFVDHAAESPPFVAAERPALDDRHAIADRAL